MEFLGPQSFTYQHKVGAGVAGAGGGKDEWSLGTARQATTWEEVMCCLQSVS